MTASSGARTATLGPLTFTLSAEELRRVGSATLHDATERLARLTERSTVPTVQNFLEPLDDLLLHARTASSHGSLLFSVHPDEAVRQAGREVSEAADRFFNEFRLNRAVYDLLGRIDLASADPVTRHAVEKMRREMRRAGVERPEGERTRIGELTSQVDRTSNEFAGNIQVGERSIEVDGPGALAGLPPDFLGAHPPNAEGRIRLTTKYPDVFPVLSYCDSAEVRRRLLHEFVNVAYPQNLEVLGRLLAERHELAALLGYPDYATYATEDKMLERPAAVAELLARLTRLLTEPTRADLARVLERKRRDHPDADHLNSWDTSFWSDGYYDTKIRQEEYGVDARALRAYLPYPAVRDGLFHLCAELFDLHFTRRPADDLWHPGVEMYDVTRGGTPIGRCYLDLAPRPGKFNHAAQFEVRCGTRRTGLPQAALVCNFLNPSTPPDEARMEYRDVVTFFHEFGHLLHALLSGHGPWLYTTMNFLEWDFVEAPSQLFEEWARDPATLARFARDPDTGRPIPTELLDRLKAAESMGRANRQLRQVTLSAISLDLYRRDPNGLDTSEVFREVWDGRYPLPMDRSYHPQAAWGHLTGYSACYYTYVWSGVLARDLLTPFRASGSLTDPVTARRYAAEILAPGSSEKAADLVRRFLGREFSYAAYEEWALAGVPKEPPARPTP